MWVNLIIINSSVLIAVQFKYAIIEKVLCFETAWYYVKQYTDQLHGNN